MGPFTAIAGGLSPELREQVRPGGRRFFGCAFALVSPTRGNSRLALMARALRHDVCHGRLRTHFPSGPSSRPVLGVQVDARSRRWKSNLTPVFGLESSSVGLAIVLPLSAGDGGTNAIPNTWRAGLFSSGVPREPQLRPTVLGARGKEASLETGAAASGTLLAPGFSAPAFYLDCWRCCPAPLFYAARHLGSATCIGNPPDPS